MNPKNYTTLETSKRLKELGVLQKSDVYHVQVNKPNDPHWTAPMATIYQMRLDYKCVFSFENHAGVIEENHPFYSAFNASELGAMMPEQFYTQKCTDKHELEKGKYRCLSSRVGSPFVRYADTEVEARAKTLIDFIGADKDNIDTIIRLYTLYLQP